MAGVPGGVGGYALTASGGLCAPLTPIYTMPNFATDAEPVWDSLPVFQATTRRRERPDRHLHRVTSRRRSPRSSEADDALGRHLRHQVVSGPRLPGVHGDGGADLRPLPRVREPERSGVAGEDRARERAHDGGARRTCEDFMLDRIKALSVNVTNGAETLGRVHLPGGRDREGRIRDPGRLRMPAEARFRALLPSCVLDLLLLDTIQTPFDRFKSKAELDAYLRGAGIDPVFYLDGTSTRRRAVAGRGTDGGGDRRAAGHGAVGDLPRGCVHRASTPARWNSGSCVTPRSTPPTTSRSSERGSATWLGSHRLRPRTGSRPTCAPAGSSRPPGRPGPASKR